MGRFKRLSAAQLALPGVPSADDLPAVGDVPAADVGPRVIGRFAGDPRGWIPAGQEDRFERLSLLTSTVGKPEVRAAAARVGAGLVCQLPSRAGVTDEAEVRHVIRFIAGYVEPELPIDVSEVFRRSVVDGYVNHLLVTGRGRGARSYRSIYYGLGRLVHPREYPLPRATSNVPKRRPHSPATDAQIKDWYSTAASLPGEQGRRAYVSLDLALGAGIRQGELLRVRGTSITSTPHFGGELAVVTLPNRAGGKRHVPIIDHSRSERILQRANEVGDASLLTPGCAVPERNGANRLNDVLRERGHRPINLLSARERWIHDLAQTVPASLLIQLADISTFAALTDHRQLFPKYGIRATVAALGGPGELQ